MPILDITLRTPSSIDWRNRSCASPGDGRSPPIRSASASDATVWSASRGQIASAPNPSRHAKRSEEHTSELQSLRQLVCRLLLEKKNLARSSFFLNEMLY